MAAILFGCARSLPDTIASLWPLAGGKLVTIVAGLGKMAFNRAWRDGCGGCGMAVVRRGIPVMDENAIILNPTSAKIESYAWRHGRHCRVPAPSWEKMSPRCWCNVGPASPTLAQHYINIGSCLLGSLCHIGLSSICDHNPLWWTQIPPFKCSVSCSRLLPRNMQHWEMKIGSISWRLNRSTWKIIEMFDDSSIFNVLQSCHRKLFLFMNSILSYNSKSYPALSHQFDKATQLSFKLCYSAVNFDDYVCM